MQFVKMHGLGNDFVVLAGPQEVSPDQVRVWCDRHVGIGADGVLVATPLRAGRVRMEYWNSDGSPSEMCGNGLRCVTRFAVDRGWASSGRFTVESSVGDLIVEMLDEDIARVEVGSWRVDQDTEAIDGFEFRRASVGNPHMVTFVDHLEAAPIHSLGSKLENATEGGINVEFAQRLDDDVILVRTWERGVGETRACGTGAVAVASVAGLDTGDRETTIRLLGGDLRVELDGDRAWITGPADYSFSGIWEGLEL